MAKKTTETTNPLEMAGGATTAAADTAAIADPSSAPLPVEPFGGDNASPEGGVINNDAVGSPPAVELVAMARDPSYGEPLTADVHPDEVEHYSLGGWYRAD